MDEKRDSFGYTLALLKEFRQQANKLNPAPKIVNRESRLKSLLTSKKRGKKLNGHISFFEVQFRWLLLRERSVDHDDESLFEIFEFGSNDLRRKLTSLFDHLNLMTNPNIRLSVLKQRRGTCLQLESLIEMLKDSDGPFEIATGSTISLFKIDTVENGELARSLVEDINKALDNLNSMPWRNLSLRADIKLKATSTLDRLIEAIDHEYKEIIGKILYKVHQQTRECEKPNHQIKECEILGQQTEKHQALECGTQHKLIIQLPRFENVNFGNAEASFESFLYCPKPDQWQKIWCKLSKETLDIAAFPDFKLCDAITYTLSRKEDLYLSILLKKEEASLNWSPDSLAPPPRSCEDYFMNSLDQLISESGAFNKSSQNKSKGRKTFNYPERQSLAAKLALNFLILCSWEYSSSPWNSQDIHFIGPSKDEYDRMLPYISCLIGKGSLPIFEPEPGAVDTTSGISLQYFTKFAKLLMEIQYGPRDGDFTKKNNYGWNIIKKYHDEERAWGDTSKNGYLEAVNTCLRFDLHFQMARTRGEGRLETTKETCRKLIRTNIVNNILKDLPNVQDDPPKGYELLSLYRDLNEQPLASESKTYESLASSRLSTISNLDKGKQIMDFVTDDNYQYQPQNRNTSRNDDIISTLSGSGLTTATAVHACVTPRNKPKLLERVSRTLASKSKSPIQGEPENTQELAPSKLPTPTEEIDSGKIHEIAHQNLRLPKFLFDSDASREAPSTANAARYWFSLLQGRTHPIINSARRSGNRPVKVAVIDTGIDLEHNKIKGHLGDNRSQIQDCRDWTKDFSTSGTQNESSATFGMTDEVGHGTAVCDILMQVAKVHLFVGKISSAAEFQKETPKRVAEAIEYASSPTGWNVDIIVLSLGFKNEDGDIREAIQNAFKRDKIILAAASNSGSIDPDKRVSYPARIQGQVLSIRSATGNGCRSEASPASSSGDDNFMALGEGIEAAWPPNLNDGRETRFVSGSSFATPVAAGIAALTLEFSIQKSDRCLNIPQESSDILWTYRGMRAIFGGMAALGDASMEVGGRMLSPWKLFDNDLGEKYKYQYSQIMIQRLTESI